LDEAKAIQNMLFSVQKSKSQEELRKRFVKYAKETSIPQSNCSPTLCKTELSHYQMKHRSWKMKHPKEEPASPDILFPGIPIPEDITSEQE